MITTHAHTIVAPKRMFNTKLLLVFYLLGVLEFLEFLPRERAYVWFDRI